MMGQHQPQEALFSYRVNLEQRVRADHPLRRINAALDLSFVRPAVAPYYGSNGNVGVDPVILVKLMLLLFLDDVASERELLAITAERLDYLWFLGYGLDDPIPNHSVLSKARARWGQAVFEDLFVRTVQQCVAAGLVASRRLHVDSSLIRADAARDSVVAHAPEMVAALRQAYAATEGKLSELPAATVNATHVSLTDPEAGLARQPHGGGTQLSYKHHRLVDDAHGVVTAVVTTSGPVGDAAQLPGLVEQHQAHTGSAGQIVVGDKHYGTAANFRYGQSHHLTTHLGVAEAHVTGIFPVSQFTYEAAQNRYRCPAGQYLKYHGFKADDQLLVYRITQASLCAACPLRAQCTTGKQGRTVTRPLFAELVTAGQAQAQSAAAQYSFKRRQQVIEGSFADASNNHGFKRARWRRLWRQQIQDWLIAAVQNLRILVRRGGRAGPAVAASVAGAVQTLLLAYGLLLTTPLATKFSRTTPMT
jgi:transposase